jgi:hypothetical protein
MGKCAVCHKPFFLTVSGREPKVFFVKGMEKLIVHASCWQKLDEKNFKSVEHQEIYIKGIYWSCSC